MRGLKLLLIAGLVLGLAGTAQAQPISALPSATTPLAGTEVLPIVQSGTTKKASVTDVRGSGTAPGGSNTQMQYNNSGAFGGISGATSNGTSVILTSPTLVGPALGTPISGNMGNVTNVPISTGVSGLGTGVSTALGNNANASGGVCTVGGGGCPSGSGTVTTTGSPANGNLTKFTGASSISNADLTGDVTTSGTSATSYSNVVPAAKGGAGTVTGALKGNGAGVVSQAACADLSNGVASCSTDTTNGANISSGNIAAARINNALLAPGPVGTGTPAAGSFTTLSASSTLTTNVTGGGTQCINVNNAGQISGTGSVCGTGSGTVTATGSPSTGNLTKFSGASAITNGDLSGDVTTSGTLATTVAKVNGTSVPASPSTHQTLVVTGASTGSWKTLPDCQDTGGNHLNYTQSSDAYSCGTSGSGGSATVVAPQGRLTLVTGTPVMSSDQTAKATVYYDCYVGTGVPYYTGSADAMDTIASCEVSTAMQSSSTGVTNSGGVFDVWWVHSGANRICIATDGSGGGWAADTGGSNTARGTGYSQVHNTRGYWTNVNTITHCYNGATDYGSVSADRATYLGSLYTTAAGQTGMAYQPAAASGGTNNILGLYNAYNRTPVSAMSRDSTASWTYNSSTWHAANASNSNRISFVDGLQQSNIDANYQVLVSGGATGHTAIDLDSTSANPQTGTQTPSSFSNTVQVPAQDRFSPQMGFHFVQAIEATAGGSMTFFGAQSTPTRQLNSLVVGIGGM